MDIIVGWATPTQPITRRIFAPDHVKCLHAILKIEAWQPFDMKKQQFRGRHLEWKVVEDDG